MSHKRLLALEAFLQAEVEELFALADASDGGALPAGMKAEKGRTGHRHY